MSYKRGSYRKSDRTCEVCGIIFQGTAKAKFCHNRCKQKAKNDKKKKDRIWIYQFTEQRR